MLDYFNENFIILPAESTLLLKEAFKLRQEVYLLEKKSLVNSNYIPFTDPVVSDEYDQYSFQVLLYYKPIQKYIGVVRLICPKLYPDPTMKLPLEKRAKANFYDNAFYNSLPRSCLAEVNRFTLSPCFNPKFTILGLLRAIFLICHQNNIHFITIAIQPYLRRLLQRFGIVLHEISPMISYYGQKKGYLASLEEINDQAYATNQNYWSVITDNGKLQIICQREKIKGEDDLSDMYNYY